MNNIFFCCTRFSLYTPNSASWKASKLDQKDYLAYLFDEDRLNIRLKIFENYSLPILVEASTHTSFLHCIQYSEELPEKFKIKLFSLEKTYDFIHLQKIDITSNPHSYFLKFIEETIIENRDDSQIFSYFYLDDDDLLSVDYFEKNKKYLNENFVGYHVSYGAGITAYYDGETYSYFKKAYYPKLNIGILRICSYENGVFKYPNTGNHTLIDQKSPTVIDSTEIMWLWTRHESQDTGISNQSKSVMSSLGKYDILDNMDMVPKKFLFSVSSNIFLEYKDFSGNVLSKKKNIVLNTSKIKGESCILRIYFELGSEFYSDKYGIIYNGSSSVQKGFYLSANERLGYYHYIKKEKSDWIEFMLESVDSDQYFIGLWDCDIDLTMKVKNILINVL